MIFEIDKLAQSLPMEKYGTGEAKSFQQLVEEIKNGECEILWIDNKPVRVLKIVFLTVKYQDKILVEDRQKFPDGRIRHRGIEGVSEKLYPGEEPDKAVRRALQEELGLPEEDIPMSSVHFLSQELRKKESPSYPGLESHYTIYQYEICLPEQLFRPEYIEVGRDGKETYFVWQSPEGKEFSSHSTKGIS